MTTYFTSFGYDMYLGTGKAMLDSFATVRGQTNMTVYYECPGRVDALGLDLCQRYPFVSAVDLGQSQYLREWLNTNKGIIPDYLGGLAKECSCPRRDERHSKHLTVDCHWQWMNRNASRWFRKVVAWRDQMDRQKRVKNRFALWLDSDTLWQRLPTDDELDQISQGHAVCYARAHREAIESGILLFDFEHGANTIIQAVVDRYAGDFRRLHRWDDGYVLTTVVEDHPSLCRDLVPPWPEGVKKHNDVMPLTVWSTYLQHLKGSHGRRLGIMK